MFFGVPSVRIILENALRETWDDTRDFYRNVYRPNRRERGFFFLLQLYHVELETVKPALRLIREGEPPAIFSEPRIYLGVREHHPHKGWSRDELRSRRERERR